MAAWLVHHSAAVADLGPDDLAIAHRVLTEVIERADRLRGEL